MEPAQPVALRAIAQRRPGSGITRLFFVGISTDYRGHDPGRADLQRNFDVTVATDAVHAVDVAPGCGRDSLEDLMRYGAAGMAPAQTHDKAWRARG